MKELWNLFEKNPHVKAPLSDWYRERGEDSFADMLLEVDYNVAKWKITGNFKDQWQVFHNVHWPSHMYNELVPRAWSELDFDKLQRYYTHLKLESHLDFLGMVRRHNIRPTVAGREKYLFNSYNVGFGILAENFKREIPLIGHSLFVVYKLLYNECYQSFEDWAVGKSEGEREYMLMIESG